ncbi:unnamed protein product [Closterium sp. NIES-53]
MVRSERGERRWWAVAEAAGSRATGATGSLATGAAGSNPPNPPPPPNPPTTAAVAARRAGRASQRAVTSGEFALFSACLPPFPSPLLLSPTCSAHRLICTKVPPMDVARNAVEDAQPHPLPPLPCRFHSSSPFLSSPLPPTVTRLICTKVSPVDVARNAVEDARSACMRTYGSAPEVEIYGDPDFTFAYVPTHLHQMVFELCKNSLRAVQERFADADTDPPPIRVVVADGIEDVTIKEIFHVKMPVEVCAGTAIPHHSAPQSTHAPSHLSSCPFKFCTIKVSRLPPRPSPLCGALSHPFMCTLPLQISDEGGGIPHSGLPRIWTYLYRASGRTYTAHLDVPIPRIWTYLYRTARSPAPHCDVCLPASAVSPFSLPQPTLTLCRYRMKEGAFRALVYRTSGRTSTARHARLLSPLSLTTTLSPLPPPCQISDEGGGIPRSGLPRIWTYLYSTARSPAAGGALQDTPSIMAGYGYGLPISRLYARYFGGDLQVVSMEGYGTDVYLHLNRLANVQEPLP